MKMLVHLSDLHFGRVDRTVADALATLIARLDPQVVAVSGDLTQRARRSQFREARRFLDLLPQPRIIVPGNHDIPLFNLPARLLNPLGGYRRYITADLQPLHADGEIAVLGLNTTRATSLKGGAVQYDDVPSLCEALGRLNPDAVKVIVGHHPFGERPAGRALEGGAEARAIAQLAQAGADVFLTGHRHLSYTGHTAERYDISGRSAIVVEAGTATSTRRRGEANAFNLLHIDAGHVAVERFEWLPASGMFAVADATRFERGSDGWAAVRK
jgi:3',5'-cyclic AMP phosphodiesterase CpdA